MLKPHQRMIGTSHLRTRVLAVEDADGRLDELGITPSSDSFYWRDAVVRLDDYDVWERVDNCPTDEIDWGKTVLRYRSGLSVVIAERFEDFTVFMCELIEREAACQ